MQLISGRVAQQYNRRRNRKGAFWTDRYHATAVGGMEHLLRCWTYIDLNMVRAGVVDHPSDWPVCGYNELQATPQRYRILDIDALLDVFNLQDHTSLQCLSREQVAVQLQNKRPERQPEWTESIAIGNEGFVRTLYRQFGPRALHLSIDREGDTYQLKDEPFALEP
jgi:putative transposase